MFVFAEDAWLWYAGFVTRGSVATVSSYLLTMMKQQFVDLMNPIFSEKGFNRLIKVKKEPVEKKKEIKVKHIKININYNKLYMTPAHKSANKKTASRVGN